MNKRSIPGLLIAAMCAVEGWAADDPSFANQQATVKTRCLFCHQGKAAQAGFDLSAFTTVESIQAAPGVWRKALQRVRDHEMPPPGAPEGAAVHHPKNGGYPSARPASPLIPLAFQPPRISLDG